jgi:hypothetical protein
VLETIAAPKAAYCPAMIRRSSDGRLSARAKKRASKTMSSTFVTANVPSPGACW